MFLQFCLLHIPEDSDNRATSKLSIQSQCPSQALSPTPWSAVEPSAFPVYMFCVQYEDVALGLDLIHS